MDDRFIQQMKKGVLEMLVLDLICRQGTYGYELLARLKKCSDGFFSLKEGTLYPILYRLEDDGLIQSSWSEGSGRIAPKKIYHATEKGLAENQNRQLLWTAFCHTVDHILEGE